MDFGKNCGLRGDQKTYSYVVRSWAEGMLPLALLRKLLVEVMQPMRPKKSRRRL
jgi:hypothetical protein